MLTLYAMWSMGVIADLSNGCPSLTNPLLRPQPLMLLQIHYLEVQCGGLSGRLGDVLLGRGGHGRSVRRGCRGRSGLAAVALLALEVELRALLRWRTYATVNLRANIREIFSAHRHRLFCRDRGPSTHESSQLSFAAANTCCTAALWAPRAIPFGQSKEVNCVVVHRGVDCEMHISFHTIMWS